MENMNLGQLTENLFQGFMVDSDALIEAVSSGNILKAMEILRDAVADTLGRPAEYMKE